MSSKELLAEYATLAAKLRHINETLQEINSLDVVQLIDKIRVVERKMGLVYTLFRSSVYSVLEQDQQQTPQQPEDELHEEEQLATTSATTTHPGRSSLGLNTSGIGNGYTNKDRLSTAGEQEYEPEDINQEHVSSSQENANDFDALPSHTAPLPQTPSRMRSNHPYHQYRSDPLLESTYRRTTLAAAHAAAATSSASVPPQSQTSRPTTAHNHRSSNVLDQFEAMTGQRSLLSLSRGYSRRTYDEGASTNRPRYY
ncbi:hypothetical protein BGW42_002656 [Actinomortierella wolfii]|nr:hypothetical protein BGW42_002656 [Actinomortierella wolfii]